MTIGERIKQRRQELGLTQEELARRLGNKTRASVCTVERDKEDLTTDRVEKYAAALESNYYPKPFQIAKNQRLQANYSGFLPISQALFFRHLYHR